MRHAVLAGIALLVAATISPAEAANVTIEITNKAAYDIRIRKKNSSNDWSSWSGRYMAGQSVYWYINVNNTYATVEIQYNNGSSWKSLCSKTISPVTSATIKATGSLFNKGCSLDTH